MAGSPWGISLAKFVSCDSLSSQGRCWIRIWYSRGVEAYGSSVEEVAHENETGFDSREKNDVKSIRNGRASGSRTGTKGASKAMEEFSKKQKKIWDKVLKHRNLLQKLDELR